MGRWGGNVVTRGRWDPQGFAAQTPQFVTGSEAALVQFGYVGQRTADVAAGIRSKTSGGCAAISGGSPTRSCATRLSASGATPEERDQFARRSAIGSSS